MKINILSTGAILAIAVTETIAAATAIQPSSSAAAALSSLGVSVPSGKVQVGNVRYTCNLLDRVFSKNETFTADDSFYDPLINEAWSQNCRLDAACIVTPKSAQEVSRLIRILSILDTKFSIRSGGHMTSPGFSSVGGNGVLVALEKLNSLSLSSDKKTVTIGPGNRWQNVYEYLEPYGLTTLGGRTPVVGVGGFVLGGK